MLFVFFVKIPVYVHSWLRAPLAHVAVVHTKKTPIVRMQSMCTFVVCQVVLLPGRHDDWTLTYPQIENGSRVEQDGWMRDVGIST